MAQKSKKQCVEKGCKQPKVEGYEQCNEHKPFDPVEDVTRLTLAEAEKWGRLDTEIRYALLTQRYKALEKTLIEYQNKERLQALERNFQEEQKKLVQAYEDRQAQMNQDLANKTTGLTNDMLASKNEVTRLKATYQELTKELAEKYQVDINKMVIDPDTRIIRESE